VLRIELQKELIGVNQQMILCGHSHIPRIVYLSAGKLIANPGSVGLPEYEDDLPHKHAIEAGSPHARYSIITHNGNNIEI
jgi:predicted phosphodiesterase